MDQRENYVGFRPFIYFFGDGTAYYDSGVEDPWRYRAEVVRDFLHRLTEDMQGGAQS
jgi:hypothetical protein